MSTYRKIDILSLRSRLFRRAMVRTRLELRQIRDVPAAAECLDQQHAGIYTSSQDVDIVAFVGQSSCLSSDHLKISIDTADVTIGEELERFFCRNHCPLLLLCFLLKDAQGGEIVLHLLKCIESGFAIAGDRRVIVCQRSLGGSTASSGVENSLRYGTSDRPQKALPTSQVADRAAFESKQSI